MNIKYRNICILLFVLAVFLGLNLVSAHDMNESSNAADKLADTSSNLNVNANQKEIVKTQESDIKKNLENDENKVADNLKQTPTKTSQSDKNIKQASKTPVTYNIIVRNNLVDNTTFDVAVINAKNNTPVPSSNLKIKLPDSSVISTRTNSSGYSRLSVNLPSGNNTLKIDYAGNATYNSYSYNLVLEVFKSNVNMSVNIVKQESGSANISVKLRDANTLNAIANANINIKLSDGRSFTVKTDKNANAFLHLDLNAGDNYVNITFDGNYKYNPANASTNLYIPTPKRIVQYNVTLNSLYVGNTSISIKLTDYNNSKILANTPLTFKVADGKTYNIKTDKNGIASFKVDEKVAKHYANITFKGNDTYNNRTETINFTVIKRVSDLNYTIINNSNNFQLRAILRDLIFNRTIPNQDIIVTLPNNTKTTRKTDANGQIQLPIPLDVANQKYILQYNGNENLTNVTKNITVNVPQPKQPVNLNVTVKSNIYLNDSIQLTLTDQKTKKPIANAIVEVKINNRQTKYKTDKNGQIQMSPGLNVGTNNIQVSYNGSDKYQNFTTVVPINITKRPTNMSSHITVSSRAVLNLTLTDLITKQPLRNVEVSVIHPQKTLQLKTDNNGRINQPLDLPAGKTRLIIKYAGNATQQAVNSTTATFTIPGKTNNKTNTIITVNDTKVEVGDVVTIKASVLDLDNKAVKSGVVNFKYNNTIITDMNTKSGNIQVKDGLATISFKSLNHWRNSNIKLQADYLENANYNPSTTKANLAVALRTAQLTVTTSPLVTRMDEKITFTATLKDSVTINDGVVIFKVNGLTIKDDKNNTIMVNVKNNRATLEFTIPDGWSARSFKLTAVYSHRNYKRAENKTYFNLTKTQTHFNITGMTAKKNGNLTINARLLDGHNHNVLGVNTIAVKINGQTLQQNAKSVFFDIVNGTVNLSFKLPDKYVNMTTINVMLVTGDRVAYLGSRYNTTIRVNA
ncbi:MAG: hypothetical protein IJJ11_04340 [Methanosphaera sp.]|nr:hypothetical protein [Methanosphaera sp.]